MAAGASAGSAEALRPGRVLDLDPDLGASLTAQEREHARRVCVANVVHVATGDWPLTREGLGGDRAGVFASIVIDGILCREVSMGPHRTLELLCAGDVLLPPAEDPDADPVRTPVVHTALHGLTVMVLGAPFLRAAARWPSLGQAVHDRLAVQHLRLIRQSFALHLPRAEHRLLLFLWTLAQRCGRVRRDGLLLPVQFTHEALSHLIGARRSTVSLALAALRAGGQISVSEEGFLLTERAGAQIRAITATQEGAPISMSLTIARAR